MRHSSSRDDVAIAEDRLPYRDVAFAETGYVACGPKVHAENFISRIRST